MKKIVIALLISATFTPAFADTKTTKQSTQKATTKIYPMDSFDPNKFSVSSIPEFTKRYFSEAEVFFKKGEFETTKQYEDRIAQGFKPKSLDSNKIYAFELDSINISYNADKNQYEILTNRNDTGEIIEKDRLSKEEPTSHYLRVGIIDRKSDSYIGSNAYGLKMKIIKIQGNDLYIKASSDFKNYIKKDYVRSALVFPVSIEKAKQYSNCNKKLYVFSKLNGNKPDLYSTVGGAVNSATRDHPLDMFVDSKVIPMDVNALVLKCSNGQIIGSELPQSPLAKEAEKSRKEAEKSEQMNIWQSQILNKAIQYWKKPESLNGMKESEIQVTVDNQGRLLNLSWLNPTGIRAIDRSIVNAFKNAAPFDPPPSPYPGSTITRFVVKFPSIQ
jgi:TonB family protein